MAHAGAATAPLHHTLDRLSEIERALSLYDIHALCSVVIVARKRVKDLERQRLELRRASGNEGQSADWRLHAELEEVEFRLELEHYHAAFLALAYELLQDRADGATVGSVYDDAVLLRRVRLGPFAKAAPAGS